MAGVRQHLPMQKRAHPVEEHIKNMHKQKSAPILIPSGSILLNLACSNTWNGAFECGRMVNLIGDSSAGKTYLALESLAQCCHNSSFDNYQLIYDDVEHALSMDIEQLFGKKLMERITPPKGTFLDPEYSRTIEDFHFNILDILENGPFIYVLDSFDALTSQQDEEKIDEMRIARSKGKETTGSYRMSKPKKASELLQDIVSKLEKTKSFLLIISQTRDNINPASFEKKTRSGGRALKFYASHEIWLAVTNRLRSKDRVVGSTIEAKVTKNKLTGAYRKVRFDFRHGYGCDDLSSCIDFLVDEKSIEKTGTKLIWNGIVAQKKELIKQIENDDREQEIYEQTQNLWIDIEESLKPNRKPKYNDKD